MTKTLPHTFTVEQTIQMHIIVAYVPLTFIQNKRYLLIVDTIGFVYAISNCIISV